MKKIFGSIIITVLAIALIVALMNFNLSGRTTSYRLSGVLSETITQNELEDLNNLASLHNAEIIIMESFPMQFSATFKKPVDCDGMEKTLSSLSYIASLGTCRAMLDN